MEHANISKEVNDQSSQEELIEATSEFFILKLLCNHTINYNHFKNLGFTPKPIPIRAACWLQGTGENVSGTAGGNHGLPIDKKFAMQFNIPDFM